VDLLLNKIKLIFKKAGLFRPFLYLSFTVYIVASCSTIIEPEGREMRYDYFPGKIMIKYANGFKVNYFSSYKIVEVFENGESKTPSIKYILVEQGTQVPEHDPSDIIIRVPLTSVSCLSTTHIPYLKALGQIDKISGIGNSELVLDSMLLEQIKKEWTMGITTSGQLDIEKILESNTNVLMAYPFDKMALEGIEKFDIPVIYVGEYLENSVLARAEWIKFFALFFNKEKNANLLFTEIENEYLTAKSRIDSISSNKNPTVFFGSFYQDVWFAPGGMSLISGLLNDAGANYLFSNDQSEQNLTLDNEVILNGISGIKFWGQIVSSTHAPEIKNFMADDQRFLSAAEKAGTKFFFANSKQSDYFGQANLEPDILLKDLGNIFYPDLFLNHQFVYFQPLN
jgi:iron complex transport system substrate-binding protein